MGVLVLLGHLCLTSLCLHQLWSSVLYTSHCWTGNRPRWRFVTRNVTRFQLQRHRSTGKQGRGKRVGHGRMSAPFSASLTFPNTRVSIFRRHKQLCITLPWRFLSENETEAGAKASRCHQVALLHAHRCGTSTRTREHEWASSLLTSVRYRRDQNTIKL